jgi:ssDNA-binding Zn-finger/Zn-ribbon topoisomerase 1
MGELVENEPMKCGEFFRMVRCSTGKHYFGKKIFCGKPGCPICEQAAAAQRSAQKDNPVIRKLESGICPDCGAPLEECSGDG